MPRTDTIERLFVASLFIIIQYSEGRGAWLGNDFKQSITTRLANMLLTNTLAF